MPKTRKTFHASPHVSFYHETWRNGVRVDRTYSGYKVHHYDSLVASCSLWCTPRRALARMRMH